MVAAQQQAEDDNGVAALHALHRERYVEVGAEQMFGVFLLVYVRPSLAEFVRGVCAEVVRTGFGSENLGIKASQIKVTGVREGSVIVDYEITEDPSTGISLSEI